MDEDYYKPIRDKSALMIITQNMKAEEIKKIVNKRISFND